MVAGLTGSPFQAPELAVPHVVRHANAALAMTSAPRFRPSATPYPLDCPATVIGYGPSLLHTWRAAQGPLITTSGAHDFLRMQGMAPDYHVEADPRPHKVRAVGARDPRTTFLLASCVHPNWWETVAGTNRAWWHKHNGSESLEWIDQNDPARGPTYGEGLSSSGLCAIELAYAMGWRRILVIAVDACLLPVDGALRYHAGNSESDAPRDQVGQTVIAGRPFRTTAALERQIPEFFRLCARLPGASIQVLGNGALAAAQREALEQRKARA